MRTIVGFIGAKNTVDLRKEWNDRFLAEGRDAFFDFYRTEPQDLELRLSEMFHLQRRGYIVSEELCELVIPLLDRVDTADKKVDVIVNDGGVLVGKWLRGDSRLIHEAWFGK